MGKRIRVSIVDDDAVVRTSLRLIIENLPEYELVSSHGSADDALGVLPSLAPAIVLLDVRMPGLSGIECARRLQLQLPEVKIVIITAHLEDALIADAFKAGAVGYLIKPFSPKEIGDALDHVRRGIIHLEGPVAARFSAWMRQRNSRPLVLLSEREVEVLTCVKRGLSDKEIAALLFVSPATIKSHLRKILEKLKVTSRSGAVSAYFDYF